MTSPRSRASRQTVAEPQAAYPVLTAILSCPVRATQGSIDATGALSPRPPQRTRPTMGRLTTTPTVPITRLAAPQRLNFLGTSKIEQSNQFDLRQADSTYRVSMASTGDSTGNAPCQKALCYRLIQGVPPRRLDADSTRLRPRQESYPDCKANSVLSNFRVAEGASLRCAQSEASRQLKIPCHR
jgi:hypothetical protein